MFGNRKKIIYLIVYFTAVFLMLAAGTAAAGEPVAADTGDSDSASAGGVAGELTAEAPYYEMPSYEILLADGRVGQSAGAEESEPELISFFRLPEEDTFGFVLPGSWDSSDLMICLDGISSLQIDGTEYQNGDQISLPVDEAVNAIPEGEEPIEITVRQTGDLPVLFIETESGSCDAIHADKTYKEPGTLLMTDKNGNLLYQGGLSAVRGRGNATFSYSKKPYQIKLEKKAALTGTREGKTWILLANALDRSLIHNSIAFGLARYCGAFEFTPNSQPVDLYMNHDYKGTYLLVEKVEVNKNRLGITDLEDATEDLNPDLDFGELEVQGDLVYGINASKYYDIPEEPEDLTGGYLVQINVPLRYETEASGFVTDRGCLITAQEPKYLSEKQLEYISGVFQQIEDALFSEDGIDPASGKHYTELLDLNTFVNKYLMAEVLDDYDGQYSYFYKDSDKIDSKVYVGPVWDQDNILGVWILQCDPGTLHLNGGTRQFADWFWFTQASRHEDFLEAVREVYREIFRPAVLILLGQEEDPQGILRSIDEYAAEVSASAQMDYFRWDDPMGINKERYNTNSGSTFEEQIRYLTDYLTARLEALDAFFLQ